MRKRAEADLLVQFDKQGAISAFQSDALCSSAAQKNASVGRVKREKIRAAEKIAATFVLFLQQLGILTKEPDSIFLAGKMQTGDQQQSLGRLIFEKLIAISFPGGCERFGARVAQKLLQYFQPAEFTHKIFVEFFPTFA